MEKLTKKEQSVEDENQKLARTVLDEKKYYEDSTSKLRDEWDDLYDLYLGTLPPSKHKSLSRNFIPKVHQAVETMASFLAGNNPGLFVTPVGEDDDDKARFMAKLLEFSWTKIQMKPKVLSWVKSAILFGVGVMKTGWDAEEDDIFAYPVNIADFYTSPYERDLQKSPSVIERLILPIELVEKKYKLEGLVAIGQLASNQMDSSMFDAKDLDPVSRTLENRVEVLERWTKKEIVTVITQPEKDKEGNVKQKGLIVRKRPNRLGFMPYVSMHAKDSPLPNRFYTTGFISPVARTQKRINQTVNQMTDNVNMMLNPSAKIRRGSGIDTREMVRYPSRAIYMGDISRDMEWDVVPDTTTTGYKMLQFLDTEFQRGTTVTDIRQGESSGGTAAEARINQSNLNTTTNLVKENVEHAVAQLGTFMAKTYIKNIKSSRALRIFDPAEVYDFESQTGMREPDPTNVSQPLPMSPAEQDDIKRTGRVFRFDKGDLDGDYDIRVQTDSTLTQNKDVLRKQMQDWLSFLSGLGVKVDTDKATKDWGTLSGIPDAMKYIDKHTPPPPPPTPPDQAKILAAVADLVKAGAVVYPNQVEAALQGKWPLPPGQGTPVISAQTQQQVLQETSPQGGEGGGESTGLPTQTETSVGITPQGIQDQVTSSIPSPLTQ